MDETVRGDQPYEGSPLQAWDRLRASNDALLAACKEFVRKCECGEARSTRSYAQMKAAIALTEGR